jgi:(p)ppGpp synthase/HD superfamily hydrolase
MLTGNPSGLTERAYVFAKAAHEAVGQMRKYTGEPYIGHPIEVAGILQTVPHTDAMLAAALLHDTVEDTQVTEADIEREFGSEVADLVSWLSDVSCSEDGNRAARKAIDLEHTSRAPAAAKTIKLADLISNTMRIVAHDPKFARVYLSEKAALLEVLKDGDPTLWARANQVLQDGLRKLENAGV